MLVVGLLAIVGGILGAAGLIIAKKPQAKELIGKLVPFQAGIGVAMLALGLLNLLRGLSMIFRLLSAAPLLWLASYGTILVMIALGFLFGMPLIAKWIPGETPAEQKAMELSKKLMPFQTILGVAAIVLGLLTVAMDMGLINMGAW